MTYWEAPISPYKTEDGKFVPATTSPLRDVDIRQVAEMIRCDEELKRLTEQVRAAGDMRKAKTRLLHYVTPMGTFSRRRADFIVTCSGLVPYDIDKVADGLDLESVKRHIFDELGEYARLAFISPSGKGIKLLVDTRCNITEWESGLFADCFHAVNMYLQGEFGPGVVTLDESGKDFSRACFLCHDPNVLYREL